jgi:hypothetical protein
LKLLAKALKREETQAKQAGFKLRNRYTVLRLTTHLIVQMSELDQLLEQIKQAEQTSEAKLTWAPAQVGDIDIRIAADGRWHHQGRGFQRDSLVKLFASILRREDDDYFLVTPAEKLRIQVDDAPFVATLVEPFEDKGVAVIAFTTNIGERVILDSHHQLRIEINADNGEPRPYLQLRHGLEALISRSAFYDLINMADEIEEAGIIHFYVTSMGEKFDLGSSSE